jgi:hypothetical protein
MKQTSAYSNHDQKWHWPEKTWFRERLNALKARENEQRRKAPVGSRGPVTVAPANGNDRKDELKVD